MENPKMESLIGAKMVGEEVVFENQVYAKRQDDLTVEEAFDLLLNPDMQKVSTAPAVLPRAGDLYVYAVNNYSKAETSKFRSDGYIWYSCSGRILPSKRAGYRLHKYYWTLQNLNDKGDDRFKRHEYRLIFESAEQQQEHESLPLIIHYLGDETVAVPRSRTSFLRGSQQTTKRTRFKVRNPLSSLRGAPSSSSTNTNTIATTSGVHDHQQQGDECYAAVDSISNRDEQNGANYGNLIYHQNETGGPLMIKSTTPRSSSAQLKRIRYQSMPTSSAVEAQTTTTKLSKNNLLGKQVEATLNDLKGDELIAARDEVYDFLRKWDNDNQ